MISAVLDTNVFAAGFVRPEPPPGQLLAAWRARRFVLVASDHILSELTKTFEEPYFRDHLTPDQRARNLALVRQETIIMPITADVHGAATHPEDDLVVATAVSGRVDYLVTGDSKLQKLGAYEGVSIVSPRQFLEILLKEWPRGRVGDEL